MCSHGKIFFKYGTMNSGKSLLLLATAHNFDEHSIPFLIFKSKIDTRDGENVVHSRALGSRKCITIDVKDNLYKIITNYIESLYYTGFEKPKWILVDADEVIIHIFTKNEREIYNLDLLWSDQPKINYIYYL